MSEPWETKADEQIRQLRQQLAAAVGLLRQAVDALEDEGLLTFPGEIREWLKANAPDTPQTNPSDSAATPQVDPTENGA